MVQTREAAVERALAKKTNVPGTCQAVTRGYYDAPSAGDQDHDSDADAVDGWKSEPAWAKHVGDRNPPGGVPLYFSGGGDGHGHRTISLFDGPGRTRSTDFNGLTKKWDAGVLGNGTIAEVEKALGVKYVGWSETITGLKIPSEPPPPPPPAPEPPKTRGENVDRAIKRLRAELSDPEGKHKRLVRQALDILRQIPFE